MGRSRPPAPKGPSPTAQDDSEKRFGATAAHTGRDACATAYCRQSYSERQFSMASKAIDSLEIGFKTTFSRTVTDEVIRQFAEVSGDHNPLHLNEEAARKTIFRGRIAHGVLSLAFVSAALAKLPGTVVYLSQTVQFIKPVRIGDTIEAVGEVIEKDAEKGEVGLKTYCKNQRDQVVLEGEARVKLFDPR